MSFVQWEERYQAPRRDARLEPNDFLRESLRVLPPGRALDIAMGEGRNAIFLARHGYTVTGVDRSPTAVARARERARVAGVSLVAHVHDLESCLLPEGVFDVIIVINYLQRSLFDPIVEALSPGGVLLYETFTMDQQKYRFHDPVHLLGPGELLTGFGALDVIRYTEVDLRESQRCVARLLARKRGSPPPAGRGARGPD